MHELCSCPFCDCANIAFCNPILMVDINTAKSYMSLCCFRWKHESLRCKYGIMSVIFRDGSVVTYKIV